MRDEATQRLGTILAVLAVAQFVAKLLGFGGWNGWRFDVIALVMIWVALSLRNGRLWARTVLIVLLVLGLLVGLGSLVAADGGGGMRLFLLLLVVYQCLEIAAVAFTLPEEGVSMGLPERWRPWATSPVLHGLILVLGVAGQFIG